MILNTNLSLYTMRNKISFILLFLSLFVSSPAAKAAELTDTIYNPPVIYTSMPRTYQISGIEVEGAQNYDDNTIIGFSGLKVGQKVEVPGQDLYNASHRLIRQGLFSQAQIKVAKTYGDEVWLVISLRTHPRISEINYYGMKKGEKDDIQERLQLMKGNQITQNIVNRAEAIIKKYYAEKGFGNAEVKITLREDLSVKNDMIVDIKVDKYEKVKVHKIYIEGNEVFSDNAVKGAMKKTNEKGPLRNLFKQKKFVESEYHDDLNRIIEKF